MSPPGALSLIWRKNLGGWNSPGSKVTWPKLQCISIRKTRSADFGWVNICACNFFVSGPNFTNFLLDPVEIVLDQVCFQVLISPSVFKIFAVEVESCSKSSRIFDFLALSNVWCAGPQNMYIRDHAHPMARHVAELSLGALPLPQKLQARIYQFLNQFWTSPLKKM